MGDRIGCTVYLNRRSRVHIMHVLFGYMSSDKSLSSSSYAYYNILALPFKLPRACTYIAINEPCYGKIVKLFHPDAVVDFKTYNYYILNVQRVPPRRLYTVQ